MAYDIAEGSHFEFARAESAALEPTSWDRWIDKAEKLAGHSLDGDQWVDGYSLDFAYVAFEAGTTAAAYAKAAGERAPAHLGAA
jgi:hypothetical protein